MKQFGNLFKMFCWPSPEHPAEAANSMLADFRLHSKDSFAKFYILYSNLDKPEKKKISYHESTKMRKHEKDNLISCFLPFVFS